ncbi:MAG: exopolysaccharide biosynthesis protein [Acidobacteria bacterium]|nr:exopolysaccharide biosynthesis protein [Acidobacteriota bacterium]
MVDIHCHILPQVDDGAGSWEMAVEMCAIARSDGIKHIVATPHANDHYSYDREFLQATVDRLREQVGTNGLAFSLGCDFHMSYDNLQNVFVNPQHYVIGSTRYLLVEFSNFGIPPQMTTCLQRLLDGGIMPVITHPERYPGLKNSLHRVLEWVAQGCVVQVTASSLTGGWGEHAEASARWLMDRDAVHVLATDAHNTTRRMPVLSKARDEVASTYGDDVAQALVDGNPRAIVSGQALPYFPDPMMKR